MEIKEWALLAIRQLKDDIAPGASGWNHDAEITSLGPMIREACITVGVEDNQQTIDSISKVILNRIATALPVAGTDARKKERNSNRGQMMAAINVAENRLQKSVDEINA